MAVKLGVEGHDRLLHYGKLALAIVAVQAFFWLLFNPIFVQPTSGSIEPYQVTNPEIAILSEPTAEALAAADYRPVPDEPLILLDRGYHAMRVSVDVPKVPIEGLGVLENGPGDNLMVFANGHLIHGEGRMELPQNSYDHLTRERIRIPAVALTDGINSIEFVFTQELASMQSPNLPLVGDYKAIEEAYGWKQFLFTDARIISTAIGFVLSFFALVALLRAKDRRLIFWLFALTFLWPLRNLFYLWPNLPLHGPARAFFYGEITLILSAIWPLFVDEWTSARSRWFRWVIVLVAMIAALAIGSWALFPSGTETFSQIEKTLDRVGLFFMGTTLLRLAWHFFANREDRYWEAAIIIMLASMMALFLINSMLWNAHVGYLALGQPLFLFAFAIAFFSRNFQLFQSSAQINALLQTQLDERTAELERAHDRETDFVRKVAHGEERQRIMRDMHDGLGSHLISLLMMAKHGDDGNEKYAEGLQQVLDEMRLMVDSIDVVGETLGNALAAFRKRITPNVKNAGFEIDWQASIDDISADYRPRDLLQIFRILQEAVTNALKHSGGDKIDIIAGPSDAPEFVWQIQVIDDGIGFNARKGRGRGLGNMDVRADSIGAKLTVLDGQTGTIVKLDLPEISQEPR